MKKMLVPMFAVLVLCSVSFAGNVPLFTADYYLAEPKQWVGRNITMSVASLDLRNEGDRSDGLRQLAAYTYRDGQSGGYIQILATRAAATRLIKLVGTQMQFDSTTVHTILIEGTFSQAKEGDRHYYVFVDR